MSLTEGMTRTAPLPVAGQRRLRSLASYARSHSVSPRWMLWAIVVGLASFGPYVTGGLRTEQLAVYLSALVVAPWIPKLRLTPLFGVTILLWGSILIVALVGATWRPPSTNSAGNPVAGLDNLTLPLAALLLAAFWSSKGDEARRGMIDVLATTICYALIVNALITVITASRELPWLAMFWDAGDGSAPSTAENAAGLGRFSGVFNHPAEAGMAYSIGLVLAMWRWNWRERNGRRLLFVTSALSVGALMTVSKVFVLVGLPVFVVLLWLGRRKRVQRLATIALTATFAIGVMSTGVIEWDGQQRLRDLLSGRREGRSYSDFLTAGRLGDDSTLGGAISMVLTESPLHGYGLHGIQIPYDSTLVELLVHTGVIGAVAAIALVITWIVSAATGSPARNERRLAAALLAIAVGSSFGLPALTANRVGSLLWILIGLALVHVPHCGSFAQRKSSSLSTIDVVNCQPKSTRWQRPDPRKRGFELPDG